VIRLAAHELSRARGGPRCMAMPLVRADVDAPKP
jgi:arginine deiminase